MELDRLAVRRIVSVSPEDSLDKAISLMEEHDIHHLPVVRSGRVQGILSDRDLLLSVGWLLESERRLNNRTDHSVGPRYVGEVMSRPVLALSPRDTVWHAACVMIENQFGAVVVVHNGTLHGILTRMDLIRSIPELGTLPRHRSILREGVSRHMRARLFSVDAGASIHEVAALMKKKRLRHVLVVDGTRLVGIVSDRDVRRAFGRESIEDGQAEELGRDYVPTSNVSDFMSIEPITVQPDTSLVEAAQTMMAHRISALPVENEAVLVGILTDTDLIRIVGSIAD